MPRCREPSPSAGWLARGSGNPINRSQGLLAGKGSSGRSIHVSATGRPLLANQQYPLGRARAVSGPGTRLRSRARCSAAGQSWSWGIHRGSRATRATSIVWSSAAPSCCWNQAVMLGWAESRSRKAAAGKSRASTSLIARRCSQGLRRSRPAQPTMAPASTRSMVRSPGPPGSSPRLLTWPRRISSTPSGTTSGRRMVWPSRNRLA